MKLTKLALLCILAGLVSCSSTPVSMVDNESDVAALATAYVSAQFSFDQETIRKITSPQFVEISPKGEVDERDAVISFYAPEKRSAVPEFSVESQKVRITDEVAVVTQTVTVGTQPRLMKLSQALTATHSNGGWHLTSSQTTPIPPPRK